MSDNSKERHPPRSAGLGLDVRGNNSVPRLNFVCLHKRQLGLAADHHRCFIQFVINSIAITVVDVDGGRL